MSQLDEEYEVISELDKCFFEPVSTIVVLQAREKGYKSEIRKFRFIRNFFGN